MSFFKKVFFMRKTSVFFLHLWVETCSRADSPYEMDQHPDDPITWSSNTGPTCNSPANHLVAGNGAQVAPREMLTLFERKMR